MRVFVAGATGVAGRHSLPRLVQAGHEVTAAVRSPNKAALVAALGAAPQQVDLFDSAQLVAAIDGHDAVVNLATKIPPISKAMWPRAWAENDRIRREASKNLVDAAIAAGATRYVQESLGFIYPDREATWIEEDVDVAPPPHARSVLDAEAQVRRFIEQGGTGTALRFAQFYSEDSPHTISMVKLARRKVCPLPGPPEAYSPMIHAEDVGTAVAAALDAPGGVYNVVDDDPLRQKELAEILSDAVGVGSLRFPPAPLTQLGGGKVRMLMRSQRVSNRRFRETADWTPRSSREGFAAVTKEVASGVGRQGA